MLRPTTLVTASEGKETPLWDCSRLIGRYRSVCQELGEKPILTEVQQFQGADMSLTDYNLVDNGFSCLSVILRVRPSIPWPPSPNSA